MLIVIYMNCLLLQNRPLIQAICPGCLWARDKSRFLSRVQRLARPVEGTEAPTGTKDPFIPVGGSTRNKRPNHFVPLGVTNPDKRPIHVIVQKEVILY